MVRSNREKPRLPGLFFCLKQTYCSRFVAQQNQLVIIVYLNPAKVLVMNTGFYPQIFSRLPLQTLPVTTVLILRQLLLFIATGLVLAQPGYSQPLLYHVQKGSGEFYILGGTEVPENNEWQSPGVQAAFKASDTYWVEIPPEDPSTGVPSVRSETVPGAGPALHPRAVSAGYGNLTISDYFDVTMGERSVVESQKLDLGNIDFRSMKPWLAYYTFYYAFMDLQKTALINPETELLNQARNTGKQVRSLFADRDAYYLFMGKMNDFAQTHYFQALYNLFDARRSGEFVKSFQWTEGNPDTQWFEKLRTQTPNYYRYMYERRNPAIAEQLAEILDSGGVHFLYLDVNRLLGPDSLIVALQAKGLQVDISQ